LAGIEDGVPARLEQAGDRASVGRAQVPVVAGLAHRRVHDAVAAALVGPAVRRAPVAVDVVAVVADLAAVDPAVSAARALDPARRAASVAVDAVAVVPLLAPQRVDQPVAARLVGPAVGRASVPRGEVPVV